MSKSVVHSETAPAAVGPYSQAIIANGFIYTAGQVPLVPETGKLIEGGIREQTEQVLKNLSAVLQAGGSSLANAVKTTVFFAKFRRFCGDERGLHTALWRCPPPARSTIEVAKLPLGALVEIEVVALVL